MRRTRAYDNPLEALSDMMAEPSGLILVDADLPLITDLMLATAVVNALRSQSGRAAVLRSWDEYVGRGPRPIE